jgi:hypothetical protein
MRRPAPVTSAQPRSLASVETAILVEIERRQRSDKDQNGDDRFDTHPWGLAGDRGFINALALCIRRRVADPKHTRTGQRSLAH